MSRGSARLRQSNQVVGSSAHSRFSAALPYAGLVLLAIIFHWPILFSSVDELIDTSDIRLYFHWLHQFTREHLLAGRLPLWDPYNYCGTPFAANPQATVFYPLSWLHLLMPVIHAHKWMIALHGVLAGSFMYMYLRRVRLDASAAFIAAAPYMLGNYAMANAAVGHLTMLFTMTWIPLALWCIERAVQARILGWKAWTWWMLLAGAVMGVQFLAGEPQNCYYTGLLVTVYVIVRTLRDEDEKQGMGASIRFIAIGLAITAISAACFSAIQLLPAAEFALHSDRGSNTYEFATFMSVPPASFTEFLMPWRNRAHAFGWHASKWNWTVQQNWDFAGYVGVFSLLLAAMSVGVGRRAALLAMLIALAISIVMMLGRFTPAYRIMHEFVPGLGLFRVPARAMILAHVSLCVMAGFGAQRLFSIGETARWTNMRWRLAAIIVLGALALAVIALNHWGDLRHAETAPELRVIVGEPLTLRDSLLLRPLMVLGIAIGAVMLIGWLNRRSAIGLLTLVLIADLFINRPEIRLLKFDPATFPGAKFMAQWRELQEKSSSPWRGDFPPSFFMANSAMAGKVEFVNGYTPLAIGRFFRYVHAMHGVEISQRTRHQLPEELYRTGDPFPLRVLNVRYGVKWNEPNQKYEVIADENALSRAWLVGQVEIVADEAAAHARMKQATFDPATTALVEQPVSLPGGTGVPGRCTARRISDRDLSIDVQADRDSLLVISEVFYPGWRITIDGRPAPIMQANHVISATPVRAGNHQVRYFYDPASVRIGGWVSGLCWTAAALMALLRRRTQSRAGK